MAPWLCSPRGSDAKRAMLVGETERQGTRRERGKHVTRHTDMVPEGGNRDEICDRLLSSWLRRRRVCTMAFEVFDDVAFYWFLMSVRACSWLSPVVPSRLTLSRIMAQVMVAVIAPMSYSFISTLRVRGSHPAHHLLCL